MKKLVSLLLLQCFVVQLIWCQNNFLDSVELRQYGDAEYYVYWFDEDTAATNIINFGGYPFRIDVSHLGGGFHTMHGCLIDSYGNLLPAASLQVYCPVDYGSLGQGEVAYWFDEMQDFDTTGCVLSGFMADVSDIPVGLHSMHCAITNGSSFVSQITSVTLFNTYAHVADSLSDIVSVNYWFDEEESMRTETVTDSQAMIDVSALSSGFHSIHAEAVLGNGIITTFSSEVFVTNGTAQFDKVIYWYDDNDTVFVTDCLDNRFAIDVSELSAGTHILHGMIADMSKGMATEPDSADFYLSLCLGADTVFESATICPGVSYAWHGRNLTQSGVYCDSVATEFSCDSVYVLTLTVNSVDTTIIEMSACDNEQMPDWMTTPAVSGIYHHYDTIEASTGCDSVLHCILTVNASYFNAQSVRWPSANGPYAWKGKMITVTGVYYDSLQTQSGCDSVSELTITFIDPYLFEDEAMICQGDYYDWRGGRYTTSGVYYDSLETTDGVDSVYQLTLTVSPTYLVNDTATLSSGGNAYEWHGQSYSVAGDYSLTYKTVFGCDSICTLHLIDSTATDIDETRRVIDVMVVPNPMKVGETAYISAEWTDEEIDGMIIEVVAATGEVVSQIIPDNLVTTIEKIDLQGIYFIRITTGTNQVYVKKLIVK